MTTAAETIKHAIKTSIRENRTERLDHTHDLENEVYSADGYEDSTWISLAGGGHVLDAWGTTEEGHEWRIELEAPVGTIFVGSRVAAGEGDDADEGKVTEIDGNTATVAWESGIRTPHDLDKLTAL